MGLDRSIDPKPDPTDFRTPPSIRPLSVRMRPIIHPGLISRSGMPVVCFHLKVRGAIACLQDVFASCNDNSSALQETFGDKGLSLHLSYCQTKSVLRVRVGRMSCQWGICQTSLFVACRSIGGQLIHDGLYYFNNFSLQCSVLFDSLCAPIPDT